MAANPALEPGVEAGVPAISTVAANDPVRVNFCAGDQVTPLPELEPVVEAETCTHRDEGAVFPETPRRATKKLGNPAE